MSHKGLIAVPYRHYKGLLGHYHKKMPLSAPATGQLRPCSPSYMLNADVLDWLTNKRWFAYQEPESRGTIARVFIHFFDVSDAVLFKLTWGGE